MKQLFIAVFILALTCPFPSAAAAQSTPASSGSQRTESGTDQGAADMNKMKRMESRQPMNMNEPMPTGMAKKGMKKGDVKAHAMKKEAVMNEMMREEKMKQ